MFREEKRSSVSGFAVLLLLGLLVGAVSLLSAAEKILTTAAGKRAKEVIELVNQGSRQMWKEYIKKNLTQKFLDAVPMERHLNIFSETCDMYGRLELEYIYEDENKDYAIGIKLKSPATESWLKLNVQVEEKPPYKIAGIGVRLSWPPEGSAPSDRELTAQDIVDILARYLDKLEKSRKFSGAVLLAKDDKILFKGAYGLASERYKVPNKIDTKFNLGSMNKMFTAVAVAQLVEKNKLSYEDLVGKYLDSSWVQPETAQKVKIKHLLSHTSGLGSFFNKKFWESSRLLYRGIDDWKPLVNDDKPKFEPGTKWSYSNTGMFLLGPIIAKASGQGYYDYIRENLYKPAGMINSGCFDNDRPVPNLAIGYEKKYTDEGFYWRNNIFDHSVKGGPAGGGFSTVEDLFHFARALLDSKLVSKEMVELLTNPKPELNSPGYGYGFTISKRGHDTAVGHGGGYTGINSILQIFKKSGYIYAIMSNRSNGIDLVQLKLDTMLSPRPR
ncbi:MAG: serine hydrolase domain-containing protein [Candidatus Aminicenantaceae bacterium]